MPNLHDQRDPLGLSQFLSKENPSDNFDKELSKMKDEILKKFSVKEEKPVEVNVFYEDPTSNQFLKDLTEQ
jgi:hypothetical protein